jgi:nucleotide-binding universal stress UspA family protein
MKVSSKLTFNPRNRQESMFKKIAVAYNESPEADRAFIAAIRLAKCLSAELSTITVVADLPAYTAFAGVADPEFSRVLVDDREKSYALLQEKARISAQIQGVEVISHIVEGSEVVAIIDFLRKEKADLLVIGLHQHNLHIARLWSTVYELAQGAPCSVLGVH